MDNIFRALVVDLGVISLLIVLLILRIIAIVLTSNLVRDSFSTMVPFLAVLVSWFTRACVCERENIFCYDPMAVSVCVQIAFINSTSTEQLIQIIISSFSTLEPEQALAASRED